MQLTIQNFTWVDDWNFLGTACAHDSSLVTKFWVCACETALRLKSSKAHGDLLWVEGVRWYARFCYFYSRRRVMSLVHWLHACFSAGLLAPGKEEFCPRRRLQTLLCTDKMTVTLSYRIKNYLSSLVAQGKIFTLSELFPLLGSQLIHLKSCIPTLLSLPTRESFNNHRGQAHLGKLGKPILPTKHFSNNPLV